MKSSCFKSFVLLVVIASTFAMTQSTSAQRRGGRGGSRGPISRVDLTSNEKVQSELKLADDQKKAIAELTEKFAADRRELFQSGRNGGDRAEMMEKMTKMSADISTKLMAKLDDAQKKRLTEIFVQVNGMNSLSDKEIAAALNVTDEQKKELTEVQAKNREAARGMRDLSEDERAEAREKLTKEANERLMAVLTEDQKEAFGKLKGEALKIDVTELRRRRGGRGGQGRGGQGQRGQRGEGRPQRPE